ncbi:hypothetical protein NDA11_000520 [Ustilago hordei]|uniref:Wax synthase domain-containing protein n=1 Tax=Ustilago hordei TaxID=120017 RepID=I2G6B1_USTHO|nr:uncharacterized protein UHO2_01967 [Ustilago hordei]KAJ1039151.1 hypothetical protein NDA10_002438 [Ustilago hordei]KAJ1586114.1 hypothetical protein NDA12_004975 [Ustilago hordei]KAJ1589045.1 hypothetical protein NDA15_001804 [Ustilago hordei]KAJ1590538.1 hypothetical protein NDA11_000520 [Ustilago hordei]KAJ1601050.1 hypothetical protein NDA14_006473 [Ustilago hordei]
MSSYRLSHEDGYVTGQAFRKPLVASWEPNFRPAVPTTFFCLAWIFVLCLTLPSRSPTWRLIRLASFPAIASISLQLTFNRTYTLGNPLRDLAMPTITWTIVCKAVEICLVCSKGGPRQIRPFLPKSKFPVSKMDPSEYAQYEWKEIEFPQLFSWARLMYGLDTLGLRRVGTSPILPKQGRALEWSKRGLNEWSRYLKVNKCKPEDIPAHSPVRRFGQPEMPFLAAALQLLFMRFSFQWLYALAAATSEMISVLGFYIPVGSPQSRKLWYSILPSTFTSKQFTLLGVPTSAFDLPLLTRLGMVLSVGGAVCLLGAVAEGTMLLFWNPKPATSFLSTFNRPVTSPGLAHLWARSWHAASQRDYLNIASFMPFSRYEPLQLLYVFFWSGVQHSWMFSRLRTSPTAKITLLTVLTGMLDQGMITFFISQGVGIWIEKAALDAIPAAWKKQRFLIGLARRLWMFTVLVFPGMLFLDSLLRCQLMTKDILDGFGLRALGLMVQGKKY